MKRNELITSLVVILLMLGGVFLILRSAGEREDNTNQASDNSCDIVYVFPESLQVETLTESETNRCAKPGDILMVHYTGMLEDGTEFDSNIKGVDQPYPLTLGAGTVISGWEEGLKGMEVGEVRRLTIPSELGYGEQGKPPSIPPDASLIFEVELVEITPA